MFNHGVENSHSGNKKQNRRRNVNCKYLLPIDGEFPEGTLRRRRQEAHNKFTDRLVAECASFMG